MQKLVASFTVIILFSCVVLFTVSCNKEQEEVKQEEEQEEIPETGVQVYMTGSINNEWNWDSPNYAKCWKNGKSILFDESDEFKNSSGSSIFVSGNDIYIAGLDTNRIVYWKNNEKVYLTDGKYEASPTSIFVYNSDVYIAGYENNENNIKVAKYWKNGVPVNLSDGKVNSYPGKLFVSNGDVYVTITMNENGSSKGMYMKNNEVIDLPNSIFVQDIFVNGSDVYVAGTCYLIESPETGNRNTLSAAYWKNGEMTVFENNEFHYSMAQSIEVSGNDVFVTGVEDWILNKHTVVYWKNGAKTVLTDTTKTNWPTSLCLHNGDVYISGYEFGPISNGFYPDYIIAKYWKNGEAFNLTDSLHYSSANDIFVVEK